MNRPQRLARLEKEVLVGPNALAGDLVVPGGATGLVLFAHGSGSSRRSSRNRFVAEVLQEAGLATLLFDLLHEDEENDRRNVFDIGLLAERLEEATDWAASQSETRDLRIGYFGASTGAAAALVAASRRPDVVRAVVSRGGRPDMAGTTLADVKAPTLLIVGGDDVSVVPLNQQAYESLWCDKKLVIVPGATHLFPEPGTLEEVARLARDWFVSHLSASAPRERARASHHPRPEADPAVLFRDREEAGRRLADELRTLELHDPVVLGIPRGGVATAAALARELGAELDVVLSRKLRAPMQPEFAVGAVGEDGKIYVTPEARLVSGISNDYMARERQHQMQEIERRKRLFRAVRPAAVLKNRTVIVTDDGIATGSTMIAALETIRLHSPRELIVAVPVAPPERLPSIQQRCDRLICLHAPDPFWAVGQFYQDFRQVEDDEAVAMLRESTLGVAQGAD
ncbi:MAG: dienelactone hydrolase family protein [Planctomycetaceae bacterium]|nr:dienelactone hydrolase family protein [Planctomycetaceae bacterium]